MASRSKFLAERSKSQNELLKELVVSETKPEESSPKFQKYLTAASKRLPNNSYLSVNSNSVQRKLDGLTRKFRISLQKERAHDLKSAAAEYLEIGREKEDGGREDVDVEYAVLQFLMNVSRNPVNKTYLRENIEETEIIEEVVDWHALLVKDFEFSDPSDEDISSGDEYESEDEVVSYFPPTTIAVKKPELSPAIIPEYAEICESIVKQYWRNHTNLEPLSELQILREVLTMLQGSPTSYIFPVHEDKVSMRDDVVVQHYSYEALSSILKYFEGRIKMVQSLHFLCDDVLNFVAQPSHPYGSRTFQAFACAIVMYLQQLTRAMCDIELKVMRQRDVVTVTELREAVREHFEIVTALYDTVQEILREVEVDSPCVCVTGLINTLFNALQLYESMGVLTEHITKVLLTILLCTLQPLLSTIDLWLAHGDLNNATGELFLARDPDISISSPNFWCTGLTLKHTDRDMSDQIPFILLPLHEKMLKAGKAIELISQLGKLGVPDADLFQVLIGKYLGKTLKTVSPQKAVIPVGLRIEEKYEFDSLLKSLFLDVAKNIAPVKEADKIQIYTEIFTSITKLHIIPSTSILKILIPIMGQRCEQVSFSLLKTLRDSFSLDNHITTLRKVLLMEAGHPMTIFCDELFKDAYMGDTIRSMTPFLRECMAPHTPFASYLRTEVSPHSNPDREIDLFECVKVVYNPPFPIDIVLDDELLKIYQRVFTLLLQIKYTAWSVLPLALQSYQHSPLPTRVHCFKYELINFVKVIQTYALQRVLHCTGVDMRRELDGARELDEYVSIHRKYCHIMEEYCLLTPEFSFCLGGIRHALNSGVMFARALEDPNPDMGKLEHIMAEVTRCVDFVKNLVKKRNQVSSVRQPHFDWLETSLT